MKILKLIMLTGCLFGVSYGIKTTTINTSNDAVVRTVELKEQTYDEKYLETFEDSKLTHKGSLTEFEGTKTIDSSLLEELDLVSDSNVETNIDVKYNFSYDESTNKVTIEATLKNNGIELIDKIEGYAFINELGEIDALMNVDDEYILLSEMRDAEMIANCGWLKKVVQSAVKVIVTTAVATVAAVAIVSTCGAGAVAVAAVASVAAVGTSTASSAQTIKANLNYESNRKKSLHSDINSKGYITNQELYIDWNFGYDTLDDVGCEVIAVYNAMVSLSKKKNLYDIIYDFEMLNIDYDIGFGALGSNPVQIRRYFNKYSINYDEYSSIELLEQTVNKLNNCKIVFTTKNNNNVAGIHSIHTMFIEKTAGEIIAYNWNNSTYKKIDKISDAVSYKFDYAYIVY